MKKLFTFIVASVLSLAASAQTISLTAEVDGASREFSFAVLADSSMVYIDWGDGVISDSCLAKEYDGWEDATLTGTVKGSGNVKIYGQNLAYFGGSSKVNGASITSIDLSNATDLRILELNANVRLTQLDITPCTELTNLVISNCPIESLDLTKCTKLQTLDASCTADHTGALSTLDLSKNTALKNLKLNYHQLEVLDLTNNLNINSVYALNNKLANIVLPAELPSCTYFSLNNNLLTSFDGSCFKAMTKSKGSILLSNNLLTSVTNLTAKSVNISNNKFKISTVPATPNVGTLTYAPQKAVEVTDNVTTKLDLSSEYDEGNTTYTLYVGTEAAAPEAYSVENGVISFHQAVENAYIAMTSSRLTNFKLSNALKTTVFSVSEAASIGSVETERADAPKFNLAGQLVRSAKGIVVVKGKKYLAK